MDSLFYWLMLASLLTHELDAVKRHEWRIFPILRSLPDPMGEQIFIWSHIPVFLLLLLGSTNGTTSVFAIGLSLFSIVHVVLHWVLRRHPACELNNSSSWTLIVLPGLLGAVHLVVVGFRSLR